MRILVIEDEVRMLELLRKGLYESGYTVMTASDGETGLQAALAHEFSAIVLDIGLPRRDGFSVAQTLRERKRAIPILMLTARDAEDDIIRGLDLGADDYMTKPFSPRELVLRVKSVLRRAVSTQEVSDRLTLGDIQIDRTRHEVTIAGKPVDFTATEFKLLALLIERRGRVQDRETLLNDVWGYETVIDTRTVDTHIRRLREKLGKSGSYIETIRGFGYRVVETEA